MLNAGLKRFNAWSDNPKTYRSMHTAKEAATGGILATSSLGSCNCGGSCNSNCNSGCNSSCSASCSSSCNSSD